jgi:hypothetical protein
MKNLKKAYEASEGYILKVSTKALLVRLKNITKEKEMIDNFRNIQMYITVTFVNYLLTLANESKYFSCFLNWIGI